MAEVPIFAVTDDHGECVGPPQPGRVMNQTGRRLRAAVSQASTAATRWVRYLLTGRRLTAGERRLIRLDRRGAPSAGSTPSAEVMHARRAALDELFRHGDHQV